MKGKIDLKDFILGVKEELIQASKEGSQEPFFELTEVEMEASFSLEASAEAKGGFRFLLSIQGGSNAEQSHTVTLKFKPISTQNNSSRSSESSENMVIEDKVTPVFVEYGMPRFVKPIDPRGPLFQTPSREYLEYLMQQGIITDYNVGLNEDEE